MNTLFLLIVLLLIALAAFDLVVGVSNDAVNFLSSAVGARVARYRTIATVAAVGVFLGASMSNGMMDVARHGIMTPMYFSFYDVMCLFLAVMVTDVILLDVFNTLGMPTSTTVSLVFELLGGAFAIALLCLVRGDYSAEGDLLTLGDLINTEKAISVILGIFLSVAIAFVLGALVQWIARLIFSFRAAGRQYVKTALLAAVASTAIIWFLLINGLKGTSLMTDTLRQTINDYTLYIIVACFIVCSLLMLVLSRLHCPVLKIVVLLGTMALAMAFASNDLVNFVGVPLTGVEAFGDYMAHGGGEAQTFMMTSLMASARTPWWYLVLAGVVMVMALLFSRKARLVVQTSVDLSRQDAGDEMFGSTAVARAIVRWAKNISSSVVAVVPRPVGRWIDKRFDTDEALLAEGAAFDEVRAVVNLVLASLLVALGTSLKLPLSTTYVTFMVAMGSSLADRAWGRESAVFRITGVLSVIGGWFITAGVAFIICFLLTNLLHFGGFAVMLVAIVAAIIVVVRSNVHVKTREDESDTPFAQLMRSRDETESWRLLTAQVRGMCARNLTFIAETFATTVTAFFYEEYRPLRHALTDFEDHSKEFKRARRRCVLGLRRINPMVAAERNTWYYLTSNSLSQMLHCLERIIEPCKEHVGNNFSPVPRDYARAFTVYCDELVRLITTCQANIDSENSNGVAAFRHDADTLRQELSRFRKEIIDTLQLQSVGIEPMSVLLNMVQEAEQLLSGVRHLARGANHFLAPIS